MKRVIILIITFGSYACDNKCKYVQQYLASEPNLIVDSLHYSSEELSCNEIYLKIRIDSIHIELSNLSKKSFEGKDYIEVVSVNGVNFQTTINSNDLGIYDLSDDKPVRQRRLLNHLRLGLHGSTYLGIYNFHDVVTSIEELYTYTKSIPFYPLFKTEINAFGDTITISRIK